MPEPSTNPEFSPNPSTTPVHESQKESILTPSQKQELRQILDTLGGFRRSEELILALNSIAGAISGLPYLSDYPAEIRSRLLERTKALLQDKQPLAAIAALGLKRLGISRFRIVRMATYSAFFHALIDTSLYFVAEEIAKLSMEQTLPLKPRIVPSEVQEEEKIGASASRPVGRPSLDAEQSSFRKPILENAPPKRRGRPPGSVGIRKPDQFAARVKLEAMPDQSEEESDKPRLVSVERRSPLCLGSLSGEIEKLEE